MFTQPLNPTGNIVLTALAALIPIIVLLILLAGLRMSAWLATLIGSIVTILVAIPIWHSPPVETIEAWIIGALVGFWYITWITIWGVTIYNTLVLTGKFDVFREWVVANATNDARVQAILLAWSFGALMEGLVGFGYPWAIVSPLLVALGYDWIKAIQTSALANNAPVSFGALGTPVIALALVTGIPLMTMSAAVGRVVALLAVFVPFMLLIIVDGTRGLKDAWPVALIGGLGYVAGQFPVSNYLGPYLPDIAGSLVSFFILMVFLKVWRPRRIVTFGTQAANSSGQQRKFTTKDVVMAWLPFIILIIVVTLWTGPWSPLPRFVITTLVVKAYSTVLHKVIAVVFEVNPFVAGTSIFVSWLIIWAVLGASPKVFIESLRRTWHQMWGAILTGFFVVGLAYVFNYSGMAYSLAYASSLVGLAFIVISPFLGFIGAALSGSNTASNTLFGALQATVGKLLGLPVPLLPASNSVGAELGKPVAPQTVSVGVSTTPYVRREGIVVRKNLPWAIMYVFYLIFVVSLYAFVFPWAMPKV
ncbi:L-lactate permease [Vulcanisaeta sp. JCM 16161]|uniref:L-lactate permease n=1 Tax=Vulcanisaeta sp. JCM 16161 TaxID=1295372 RepID=UPI00406C88F5